MLGKTYAIAVPPVTSATYGNKSTFHQEHVSMHQTAFALIDRIMRDVKSKTVKVPAFFGV
jgi:hypothetical protein